VRRVWSRLVEGARRYLVAGILAFAPLAITIWAIAWIIERLDNLLLPRVLSLFLPSVQEPPRIPLLGALFTLLVIILLGIIARHVFGGQLHRAWERLLSRVPVARNIYGGVKQLFDAIFSGDRASRFHRVVLIEYPRKGIYAMAFTTGPARGPIQAATQDHMINCFLPTTPNPTSGFYLLVPEQEIITVDLSVEEGFKLIMSAGLVTPGDEQTGEVAPIPGVGHVGPAATAK